MERINNRIYAMDVNVVNPFIEAALNTLETTAQVKVRAFHPYLKPKNIAEGDISALMEMTGDYEGTIAVSFSKEAILGIVSSMFGEEMTEMNDEIKDAVGEIANMISGQVTNKLAEMGNTLKVAMAEVSMGSGHSLDHIEKRPVVAIPFKTEQGRFTIEVCFEQ